MTKKDYELIAQGIYSTWYNLEDRQEKLTDRQLFALVDFFIINLRKDNPKFSPVKFVEHCLPSGKVAKYAKDKGYIS